MFHLISTAMLCNVPMSDYVSNDNSVYAFEDGDKKLRTVALIFLRKLLAPTGALVLMMVYYIYIHPLFQIFTQSLDAIDVTSVTLSRLNTINAIDVTR